MLVDRRIVEDLPALLGSLQVDDSQDSGLKPPRLRKRSGLRALTMGLMNDTPPAEDVHRSSEKENEGHTPAATAAPQAAHFRLSVANIWATPSTAYPLALRHVPSSVWSQFTHGEL
uniref:Carboxylic ester hydrolase (EC) n=1 Tax=Ganoderma boninense TaxID=34458 RepID=A0A5K1JY03_9APHY|nr:Carboxylic ester hydrolase (EC [Ganoderma boninense]